MGYFYNLEKLKYIKEKGPEGCILCLIGEGDSQVEDLTVYRGEDFLVSVNLYPYNPGHLLIFPRRHLLDMRELTVEESARLAVLEKYFIQALDDIYSPHGFNMGYNMGRDAGGSIDHLHLHIIPRYRGEVGIADIVAGQRMLVELPEKTRQRILDYMEDHPIPGC